MRKAILIVSLTAFAAVAAVAAPRRDTNVPSTTEEVAGNPVEDLTKPVDEKAQGCGCNKPKKGNR